MSVIEQGFQAANEFLCSGQIHIEKPHYLGGKGPARWEGLVFRGYELIAVVAADEQAKMHQKAEELILARLVALSEEHCHLTAECRQRRLRHAAESFRLAERDSQRIPWRMYRVENYQLPNAKGYVSLDPHCDPETDPSLR